MKPSDQQMKILAFPYTNYDALICDGSIRAGKTCMMMWAFIDWAMRNFNGKRFAICGKTVDSAVKNILQPFLSMTLAKEKYSMRWRRQDHILEAERGGHRNIFEVFGGKDESSYALIQGRTLAGVLLDEVALMPRSFVEQALARCSEDGSKFFFNCNPDSAQHWFNTEWIQKAKEHNALHLHFTLDDNPGLSDRIRERYKSMYAGVFYKRYILGLWVMADGLVYDMFDEERHIGTVEDTEGEYYVSCDYGIQNATVFLLWRKEKGTTRWVCLNEYYYSGRSSQLQKTVGGHADGLQEMLGDISPKAIIVDPSASALIVELRKRKYHVLPANNDVLDGISDVSTMLRNDRLIFDKKCKNTIEEFGVYCWDKKAADRGEDRPVKDYDHCMDAVRYMVKTKRLCKNKKEYVPII